MQNFDDLDIEGRNPSHITEEEREKEEHDRKRLMRSSVTAEDGILRPVYSKTEDGDIWCHICNIALFGAHKLISHNSCNRHKMKLDEWPYPVLLWSKRNDIAKKIPIVDAPTMDSTLAPGEPVPPGMEDQMTRTTTIQVSLDRHRSSPLVGLEYLLEMIDSESCEPSYTCVLCDKRGDPRTVMAHITSYNHRITYLNRHFPTISRAITELPRTPNYKRGANEISVLVAKKIEEQFGRLQPQLVDKNQFEKNKMQYIKRVYQDYHFRETPELTFMEVYDVRWVTNFDEKMAEMAVGGGGGGVNVVGSGGVVGGKKDSQTVEDKKIDRKNDKEQKFNEKNPNKKQDSKSETTKSGFKIRILTKDKMNLRKPSDRSDDPISARKSPKRPSDDTKSLSSLSSISSSPSPSRSRSRSPQRGAPRRLPSIDRTSKSRGRKSRYSRSRTRTRSRSIERLKERDKWDKYKDQIRRAEENLDRSLQFHEKNPEKHPSYPDEWKKFWNRRYKELQSEGKDPSKHDFKPEWIEFWNKRMRELHNEQLQIRKEEIRKRLELPDEKPIMTEKWIPPPASKKDRSPAPIKRGSRHRVESDDDVEYVGTKTLKTHDYYDRIEIRERDYGYNPYIRGRSSASYRSNSYYPPVSSSRPRSHHYSVPYSIKEKSSSPPRKEDTLSDDMEIVGLLRLLTALEGQLGSLGPKVVALLSKALAAEKVKPNSAEELLFDEEVNVLFETVKEKLKGQLFAGMIEKLAITPTKTAIQNIARILHKASETKKKMEEEKKKNREIRETLASANLLINRPLYQRPVELNNSVKSEPVSVPGIGTVDKVAIAQQIAAALIAQGRTNVSQEELETLINAVVGMAEASKNSEKPVTTADFVKGLAGGNTANNTTGSSIVDDMVRFNDLKSEKPNPREIEHLSDNDLKNLLQNFKDLGTPEQHGLISFLKKLEATDVARVEKLRGFVNLGSTFPTSSKTRSPSPGNIKNETIVSSSQSRRSISPFSARKGNQNPPEDEDNKWKPKLDMFADDEGQNFQQPLQQLLLKKKKDVDDSNTKQKIDLSDDDDDYTFEDIYKAANKNVHDNEKAKLKDTRTSPKSWSRSPSRSRSPLEKSQSRRNNDPNSILNETKRLIANIMGELPNKFTTKTHSNPTVNDMDNRNVETINPTDFYNRDYSTATSNTSTMSYNNLNAPQQFHNYQMQQQAYPSQTSNYVDNSAYNYQGYGNMQSQTQYNMSGDSVNNPGGVSSMMTNPYSTHQAYGVQPFSTGRTDFSTSYPQQAPQPPSQFGNFPPQQRFY